MPLISIQICCYNSQNYLDNTIKSVVGQDFRDWELIIINDGSSDGTERIVENYLNKGLPVIYATQPHQGFPAARNKALELSRGEWIAILDSEDLWLSDKLQIQSGPLKEFPEIKLHFSNSVWFDNQGRALRKNINENKFPGGIIDDAFFKLISQGCFVDSETVIMNKQAIIECGGFNEDYLYMADYDMFLKVANRYGKFYYTNKVLAKWRVHNQQLTSSRKDLVFKEYIKLFTHILDFYTLPALVKREAERVIISNRLKYAFLQLSRAKFKDCFSIIIKEVGIIRALICIINEVKRKLFKNAY